MNICGHRLRENLKNRKNKSENFILYWLLGVYKIYKMLIIEFGGEQTY
jgi:hypothetical protein